MSKIEDKIKEVQIFLEDLKEMTPQTLEDYTNDKVTKAACERYAEKIIEAITDIAFLTIKLKRLEIPEDDYDAFNVLHNNHIIDNALRTKLKRAKGMRNILAHEYGKVDDEKVFNAISKELEEDTEKFIEEINKAVT